MRQADRQVVEPDDGDVAGDPPARAAQGPHRADRHHVRGGEDGVDVRPAVQQPGRGVLAGGLAEVAEHHQPAVAVPGTRHRLPVPEQPVHAGGHVLRPGDGRHGAAARVEQALGGPLRAARLSTST